MSDSSWTRGTPPVKLGKKRVRLDIVVNDSLNIMFKSTNSFFSILKSQ